ncbi:MAG: pilus assembly protein PilQ [Candidatus Krumholzibacteriota bacterium]|nr:pilus assembly protein PilQ [Candidatus Krumholzibacteriota bacterium]
MRSIFASRKTLFAALLLGALVASTTVQGDTSQVSALRMENDPNGSPSYVISKTGAVEINEFLMDDPPRLVLDFLGAAHGIATSTTEGDGKYVLRVRSSQFASSPELVTRVVFDLKAKCDYRLTTEADRVVVRFQNGRDTNEPEAPVMMGSSIDPSLSVLTAPVADKAAETPAAEAKPVVEPKPAAETKPAVETKPSVAAPATKPTVPDKAANETDSESEPAPEFASWDTYSDSDDEAEPVARRPVLLAETPTLQSFSASAGLVSNRTITIDVQEADIQSVLRSFSEFSNTNIVAGPEVEGKVTAHLANVPWRQAMDIILKSHGFGYREEYGMIRVSTVDKLTKEELEVQAAERQKDDLLPLETRIVPLSFARAAEMKEALKEIISQRGSIEVEAGMNSLIVNDISKNVDKVVAMVADLDKKIQQVEIVAKLVDVDYDVTREMGIRWDLLNLSAQGVNAVGDAVIDARSGSPTGTLRVGTVQSWGEVQAILDVMEQENKANVISNPRIVTAENREASILVGKEIPLIVSDEAGNPITELTKIGIILRVTPHVNLDKTITLDLHPEVSDLAAQATVQGGVVIMMSEADTRVIVGDGETAVIGGLISESETNFENGVPVLKDIPLLGGLFKFQSDNKKKRELVIFVTPKIVS